MPRYNLSCAEHSPEGQFLGHLYYNTNMLEIFTRDERSGCPHSGGQHKLVLNVSHDDLAAFLDVVTTMFEHSTRWSECVDAFVQHALRTCMHNPVVA